MSISENLIRKFTQVYKIMYRKVKIYINPSLSPIQLTVKPTVRRYVKLLKNKEMHVRTEFLLLELFQQKIAKQKN